MKTKLKTSILAFVLSGLTFSCSGNNNIYDNPESTSRPILNGIYEELSKYLGIIRVSSEEAWGWETDNDFFYYKCINCTGTIYSYQDNIAWIITDRHCTQKVFNNCIDDDPGLAVNCPDKLFVTFATNPFDKPTNCGQTEGVKYGVSSIYQNPKYDIALLKVESADLADEILVPYDRESFKRRIFPCIAPHRLDTDYEGFLTFGRLARSGGRTWQRSRS